MTEVVPGPAACQGDGWSPTGMQGWLDWPIVCRCRYGGGSAMTPFFSCLVSGSPYEPEDRWRSGERHRHGVREIMREILDNSQA